MRLRRASTEPRQFWIGPLIPAIRSVVATLSPLVWEEPPYDAWRRTELPWTGHQLPHAEDRKNKRRGTLLGKSDSIPAGCAEIELVTATIHVPQGEFAGLRMFTSLGSTQSNLDLDLTLTPQGQVGGRQILMCTHKVRVYSDSMIDSTLIGTTPFQCIRQQNSDQQPTDSH